MTADAIVNMAQQAGYPHIGLRWNDQELSFLERFGALAVAADRAMRAALATPQQEAQAGVRPTPTHLEAMERAWLWMENQADGQSKGGHATFDLMMLREERDALRAAIDAAPTTQPSPPQEAQEPVAVVVPCHTPSGKRVALYSAKQDLPIGTQLYLAPQPVECEPLTREQVKAICVESGYETATLQERADFINGIRHAERHHGIKKGGQHGAE